MREHISMYLEFHSSAWASSTLKSESSRLRQIESYLDKTPEHLYEYLKTSKKPYTIKTTFIRVCDLEKWIGKSNKFRIFMEKHERRFKHLYEKEECGVSYFEACKRIEALPDPSRSMAFALLTTGCRISEAYTFRDGRVTGKGGKVRKVYGTIKETEAKSTFTRKLKAVGLKPHTLRKLCATRLAEKGASPADLCKIFGWSSISTAYQYLQAKEDSKIETLMAACQEKS